MGKRCMLLGDKMTDINLRILVDQIKELNIKVWVWCVVTNGYTKERNRKTYVWSDIFFAPRTSGFASRWVSWRLLPSSKVLISVSMG